MNIAHGFHKSRFFFWGREREKEESAGESGAKTRLAVDGTIAPPKIEIGERRLIEGWHFHRQNIDGSPLKSFLGFRKGGKKKHPNLPSIQPQIGTCLSFHSIAPLLFLPLCPQTPRVIRSKGDSTVVFSTKPERQRVLKEPCLFALVGGATRRGKTTQIPIVL